jgi:ABC-type Zn uptake system ZnuABC Zn-binding protein ZnuA
MAQFDPANAAYYTERPKQFNERWNVALAKWERAAAPPAGVPVVVQHKAFTYLIAWMAGSGRARTCPDGTHHRASAEVLHAAASRRRWCCARIPE